MPTSPTLARLSLSILLASLAAGDVALAAGTSSTNSGRTQVRTANQRASNAKEAARRVDASAVRPTRQAAPKKAAAAAADSKPSFVLLCDSYMEQMEPDRLMQADAQQKLGELGAAPLRMIYSNIDKTQSDGLVHVEKVVAYVKQVWGDNPEGWFMLDYEIPHMKLLNKGYDNPQDPDYKRTLDSMVNAIKVLKEAFPNAKWTYYGIPGLNYYFPSQPWPLEWSIAPQDVKEKDIERRLNALGPLLEAVDWISPTIYDRHESAKASSDESRQRTTNTYRERIAALVQMGKQYLQSKGLPDKPVIPTVNAYFAPGGNTLENKTIPVDEVMRDQVQNALDAGADGVAIWSCVDWYIRVATANTYNDPNRSGQARIRKIFKEDLLQSEPSNWASPEVRSSLLKMTGDHLVKIASAIRSAAGEKAPAAAASSDSASKAPEQAEGGSKRDGSVIKPRSSSVRGGIQKRRSADGSLLRMKQSAR